MGVLLGGFIEGDPDVLEGATSYFDFVVPGLIAAHAMQTAVGETTFPVMGMIKWQRIYDSMLATPLGCRDLVAAHLSFVLFRLATTCGVYRLVLAPFGVYGSWWGPIAAFLSQLLVGMAFAVWVYGYSARLTSEEGFGVLFRLGDLPALPVQRRVLPDQQPRHRRRVGRPVHAAVARRQPLAHVRARQRHLVGGRGQRDRARRAHRGRLVLGGLAASRSGSSRDRARGAAPRRRSRATQLLVQRNYIVYRKNWKLFVTGFFEPFFYLLSIGIGVGQLIDTFEFNGRQVPYAEFVAPGMLAASALNGALIDATYNTYFKLRFMKLYDQMLATPLTTARRGARRDRVEPAARVGVRRGVPRDHGRHGAGALVVGDPGASPRRILIGFASSAVCMAATTYMKSWQDFDKITLVQLPLFLFSGTFFPISAFPTPVQWLVECTPLYRGVVLCRELTTGALSWASAVSVLYLVAMGLAGLVVVRRRLDALLLT